MAQVLREFIGLNYDAKEIKEAREANRPVVLSGVLQRADAVNQNGRVYPKQVLEREIANYRKAVAEGRAVGECVPAGTEIYTPSGWRKIEDVKPKDIVYTLNTDTNKVEAQRVLDTVAKPYDDKLVRIYNEQNVDMTTTKGHLLCLWQNNGTYFTLTAEEIGHALKEESDKFSNTSVRYVATTVEPKDFPERYQFSFKNLTPASFKVKFTRHEGYVYCVRVPNKTWLMRQNGCVTWTHNCDHPDKSVVELKNVSHVVRDIGWNGSDVVGKVEILNTPSGNILKNLMEAGIRLGISSRGVGEVQKNNEGNDVVDESFVLICFDVVSEPSTQGAWLKESRDINLNDIYNKLSKRDRVNRIANEILRT